MPRGRLHRPACLGGSIMSEFIPLSVPNFGAREAELAGLAITSGWVSTSGGKVTEFEEKLAAYVGMPRAVACNAGSSALHLAAMAAGITRGDEVIVPTLTFIAAVNPLTRYVGAEPIFIGCDDSLCIDPDAVEDFCANHCELRDGKLYNKTTGAHVKALEAVPFPVSWTVKMKKKQKETQDILSYHTQAAGCSDKARAKASGGRQPIEECGRTGL